MEYVVTGPDGIEYGPVTVDVLKTWAAEDRVRPNSMVRDFHTGQTMRASQIAGLFSTVSPTANPYSTSMPPVQHQPMTYATPTPHVESGNGEFWGSIVRSVLAVAVFFFLHGLGLVFAGYAMFYAIQAKSHGNRYGVLAIVVASVALLIVIVGWLLRFNGSRV